MKVGIIKEGKIPVDHRVAFTPTQCAQIIKDYPHIELVVQPSDIRSYTDQEYADAGITLQDDVSDCDILFGVKEVPLENLIADKTYFFFSHTIKKQAYNKTLLQTILSKNIALVDYECLTNANNVRVVAFGRFAGIVGAYNGLRAYGIKKQHYDLKPAHLCKDILELFTELNKVSMTVKKGLKVLLTGGGRVAKGAIEVLEEAGLNVVDEEEFEAYQGNCFLQLEPYQYNRRIDGEAFDYKTFYANPEEYEGTFTKQLTNAQVFIAGAFWDPKAPVLFDLEDVQNDRFSFEVIADITCDIQGSVPTTIRSTTIDNPFYDFNKESLSEEEAFSNPNNITIMSVDNLPCELPRDASESFGEQLTTHVLPTLFGDKKTDVVSKAMIASNGELTEKYLYLTDYVNQ